MKTENQIELKQTVAPRRNLAPRTAVAPGTASKEDGKTIRPFHVNVPEAELTELRRRINATKWPERETVS